MPTVLYKVVSVSETLRSGLGKEVSVVDDVTVTCHRILHILQKDAEEFGDHVTHVSGDVRNYARDQKQRVTDDATVQHSFYPTVSLRLSVC